MRATSCLVVLILWTAQLQAQLDVHPLTQGEITRMTLVGRVNSLRSEGKYEEALSVANELLSSDEATHGNDHIDYAKSLHVLAEIHQSLKQWDDAERRATQAVEVAKGLSEKDPYFAATFLKTLGLICFNKKQYGRAEAFYGESLDLTAKMSGGKWSRNSNILGYTLHRYVQRLMGQLHCQTQEYEKAEQVLRDCQATSVAVMGPESLDYAEALGLLAIVARKRGQTKMELGLSHYAARLAGSIARRAYDMHLTNDQRYRMALVRSDDLERAEAGGLKAMEAARSVYTKTLRNVAEMYKEMGKNAEAKNLLRQAETYEAEDTRKALNEQP